MPKCKSSKLNETAENEIPTKSKRSSRKSSCVQHDLPIANNESVDNAITSKELFPDSKPAAISKKKGLDVEIEDTENIANADKSNYFQSLHDDSFTKSKIKKSAIRPLPSLDISIMKSLIDKMYDEQKESLKDLHKKYKGMWPQWKLQLENGFNLVFYGFGSKKDHLESFVCESFQSDHHLFIFNGYFPTATLDSFLQNIQSILSTSISQCKNVLILMYNVESDSCFRNGNCSLLAFLDNIRELKEFKFKFVFTIDHVNASFVFSSAVFSNSNCNFLMHELTTFQLYKEETSFENSFVMKTQNSLGLRALRHILQSVTINAQKLFCMLGQLQVEIEKGHLTGVSAQTLFQKGKDEFLFGNDLVFRTLLSEFIDHKAILSKKSIDGTENLCIPIENEILQQILKDLE